MLFGSTVDRDQSRRKIYLTSMSSSPPSPPGGGGGGTGGWRAVLANDGLLRSILQYVGPKQFRFVAPVNWQWKRVYTQAYNGNSMTSRKHALSSTRTLSIQCQEDKHHEVRSGDSWPGPAVARTGNLTSLQWLWARHWRQGYHRLTTCVLKEAAAAGNLTMLRWARANGCDWNDFTCEAQLEVVVWTFYNGPEPMVVIGTIALAQLQPRVVIWKC